MDEEELMKKIRALEEGQAELKREVSKLHQLRTAHRGGGGGARSQQAADDSSPLGPPRAAPPGCPAATTRWSCSRWARPCTSLTSRGRSSTGN